MQIYYVHHALRDKGNPPTQADDITELGRKDAILSGKILSERIKSRGTKLIGIFTAPEFRHTETARFLNESLNAQIFLDERLSEMKCYDKSESWVALQTRVREAIKYVVMKYDADDTCAVMVTSGVNLAGFIDVAYKLQPSETAAFPWVHSCSPIGFDINKSHFEESPNGRS
ncbi:MAG: histidine phosphatase family protein [Clostridia bacterium]|nr:histidine phosphatase family protein [Clostridia bacterium]